MGKVLEPPRLPGTTAQGGIISEKNETLCEERLRSGLADCWYPGANTSEEEQLTPLKCCLREQGLELTEHREIYESTVTSECCSLQHPRRWPFLGLQTRCFREGMLTQVRPEGGRGPKSPHVSIISLAGQISCERNAG